MLPHNVFRFEQTAMGRCGETSGLDSSRDVVLPRDQGLPIKDHEMADRELWESMFSTGGLVRTSQQSGNDPFSATTSSSFQGEHVLSVEAVMDVARAILWPDSRDKRPSEFD